MTAAPGGVRLAALDIDGTILDFDERLSGRVRSAIGGLIDAGIHVILATGRSVEATLPVLDLLGLTRGWAVCSNGAVGVRLDPTTHRGHELAFVETFDPTAALQLIRGHLPTALYAVEDAGRGYRLTAPFPAGELTGPFAVVPFEALLHRPATRVIVRSPGHSPVDFQAVVERIGLHQVNYAVGWTAWLDLAPEGISKASALERIRRRLEVSAEATGAVGDGRNDLEMFAWAGRSVAMGQAVPEVIAAADEVTGSVQDDGLADVLEHWRSSSGDRVVR